MLTTSSILSPHCIYAPHPGPPRTKSLRLRPPRPAEAIRLQVRNVFTEIHLRKEDRAVVPPIARRSDSKVLIVVRIRGCQMRVTFCELQGECLAVDVFHYASGVLREEESLVYQLVIISPQGCYRGDGQTGVPGERG